MEGAGRLMCLTWRVGICAAMVAWRDPLVTAGRALPLWPVSGPGHHPWLQGQDSGLPWPRAYSSSSPRLLCFQTHLSERPVQERGLVVTDPSAEDVVLEHRSYCAAQARERHFAGEVLGYVTPVSSTARVGGRRGHGSQPCPKQERVDVGPRRGWGSQGHLLTACHLPSRPVEQPWLRNRQGLREQVYADLTSLAAAQETWPRDV